MKNVAVFGAAGYTGRELLKILLKHPDVNITAVTSDTYKGESISAVLPEYAGSLTFISGDDENVADDADAVFLCLPHTKSMSKVPSLLGKGKVVFDLSADFRLKDVLTYEKWYGVSHAHPALIEKAVYGLPEIYRDKIANADLVAVPGCYPTSSILPMIPLLKMGWFDTDSIVINSASGTSGAGRKAEVEYSLAELEGNFFAYGSPTHRHTPEIEQVLSSVAGSDIKVTFIPHLLPTARGIYTTITAGMNKNVSASEVLDCLKKYFADEPFVRVVENFPKMREANGTNVCVINATVDERSGRLIVTSTIDNLIKGAGGQAVQCFNIRFGIDEAKGQ